MPKYLSEVYQTLGELICMHQLNQELLETLSVTMQWIRGYAEKHSISLPDDSTCNSLINKAEALIEEITTDMPLFLKHHKPSDEFSQRKPSDEDYTEPTKTIFLSILNVA
jgi:hypothetical protein